MDFKKSFEKEVLNHENQLELLRSRGLNIGSNKDFAKLLLQHRNYYRLSAYWFDKYKDAEKQYFIEGLSLKGINDLYEFDRKLRILILEALERLEVSFRSNLAYILANDTKNPHSHLDRSLFHAKFYMSILENIEREVKQAERTEVFIEYHLKTYSEKLPPIWVCCEVMSLGSLSRFYSAIKSIKIKTDIAKVYSINKHETFESWLRCLSDLRNYCAHHSRIFNRSYPSYPRSINSGHLSKIEQGIFNNWNKSEKSKIYNLLVILSHLLKPIPLAKEPTELIQRYCLKHTKYLEEMGFPQNWNGEGFE